MHRWSLLAACKNARLCSLWRPKSRTSFAAKPDANAFGDGEANDDELLALHVTVPVSGMPQEISLDFIARRNREYAAR